MNIPASLLPIGSILSLFEGMAQVPAETVEGVPVPVPVVSETTVVAAPQFFIALLSGVILAFGFQLLLTNLSMAAGVSYVAHSSSSSSSSSDSNSGSGIKTMGIAFGLWTLVTGSLALFFACRLAIRLTAYGNPFLGVVTGLVIWATYFSLLMWFSSTAVGSLIGSVMRSATHGFQTMVGAATAAFGANQVSSEVVQTAEAAAAAVRRELSGAIDTTGIQESLQDYIGSLKSADVDVASVEQEFERLIYSSELADADRQALPNASRELFEELLKERTNLSTKERKRVANRLYRVWQNYTGAESSQGMDKLMAFVASATGSQLASQGLGNQLSQLVGELRQQNRDQNNNDNSHSPLQQGIAQSMSSLVGMIMGKVDMSDMDASKLVGQIQDAQRQLASTAQDVAPDAIMGPGNIIKADVENYLQHAYIGELKSPELENRFRNVLFDPEANETEMRRQLSEFGRPLFVEQLKSRGFFTQAEIKDIATRLEIVRQQVLKDVSTAEIVGAEKRIRMQLETFFKYTPASELNGEMGEQAFRAIVEHEPLQVDELRDRLKQLNADYYRQFLVTRNDVTAHETAQRYEQLMQRILADADGATSAAKVRLQQQKQSLEQYLRQTNKAELNPEGIKRDLKTLLDEPNEGIRRVRGRLAEFDRDTLVAALGQRPEFSEQEVDDVLSSVEQSWTDAMQAPSALTTYAQSKFDEATGTIAQYLRETGKPELSPEGIKRDLQKLIDNPKVGAMAIRYRLSKMDRDTLVQLLAQRNDLNADEVNRTIDSVLSTIQGLVRSPRRLARRATDGTQSQALSFQSALEDYLGNTNKSELNPEGIKRDVKTLLNDPKLGASRLSDRLSQMDDSTMVALLAQRSDMTEAEAQQIVGQIADVRHQIKDQVRSVQHRLEMVVEGIFARIRDFLQSLDRPELDYYGIKRDVRTLMDDPQAGFDALRLRLSDFDRDTLVALVSAHDGIAESDAYRVIDQIESAKDSVLRKAEAVERQVSDRVSHIKAQTQQQVEDAKKAAEVAAWWLFGTALISAIVAAIGGHLAVAG